jgi:TatD DNase family protein
MRPTSRRTGCTVTAAQRDAGQARQPNEPAELPRIGAVVAGLRGIAVEELALATVRNAGEALPGVMEGIS